MWFGSVERKILRERRTVPKRRIFHMNVFIRRMVEELCQKWWSIISDCQRIVLLFPWSFSRLTMKIEFTEKYDYSPRSFPFKDWICLYLLYCISILRPDSANRMRSSAESTEWSNQYESHLILKKKRRCIRITHKLQMIDIALQLNYQTMEKKL